MPSSPDIELTIPPSTYSGYDSCKGDFDYWFVKPYCEPDCWGKDYDSKKEKKKQQDYKPKHDEKKKYVMMMKSGEEPDSNDTAQALGRRGWLREGV